MNTDLKVAPISRFLIRCSLLLIETFEGADNEEIYRECVFVSAGPMTTLAASVFNVESRKKKVELETVAKGNSWANYISCYCTYNRAVTQ